MTIKSVGKDEQDVQSERENIRMKKWKLEKGKRVKKQIKGRK